MSLPSGFNGAGFPVPDWARHAPAKDCVAVRGTRGIGKAEMKLNDALPAIEVDPETTEVRADGELLTCERATVLPMAPRHFLD